MNDTKYPLKLIYRKENDMRYFSQLDLVRIFERALRRARLPVYFTKGFNPHVKMSFGNALKVGVEGESTVTFYLVEPLTVSELIGKLKEQLPEGLVIKPYDDANTDTQATKS